MLIFSFKLDYFIKIQILLENLVLIFGIFKIFCNPYLLYIVKNAILKILFLIQFQLMFLQVPKYVVGQKISFKCQSCFATMNFFFQAYNFATIEIQQNYSQNLQKNDDQKNQQQEKIQISQILRKKIGIFKIGTALPKNGTCKHYSHSNRYFRFPCCGKAFPCDECHNESEKKNHEMILATSMICGFCSQEQKISDICKRCNQVLTKQKLITQHWEGGKGCRNQNTMSKNDKKKYQGLGKTVSKKKKKKQ